MPSPDATLLDTLVPLALRAGEAVMAVYRRPFFDVLGHADSPHTEADLAGEAIILEGLARRFPAMPVVAEEECKEGRMPDTPGRFFLVDALDGTKEFIKRNGQFTVNIALVEDGVPVAGVVHVPASGELFAAAGGRAYSASVSDGAASIPKPLAVRRAPPAIIAVRSGSRVIPEMDEWLARYSVEKIVPLGSSLKFCRLASGEADLYPCLGPTMEWDTAAGDAILRAAGGLVVSLDGRPLRYNKRGRGEASDFLNGHFVACGDPRLASAV